MAPRWPRRAPRRHPPTSRWEDQQIDVSSARYAVMEDRYQVVAREQVICGCHVHWRPPTPSCGSAPSTAPSLAGHAARHVGQLSVLAGRGHRLRVVPDPDLAALADGRNASRTARFARLRRFGARDGVRRGHRRRHAPLLVCASSARFPTIEFRVCDVCLDPPTRSLSPACSGDWSPCLCTRTLTTRRCCWPARRRITCCAPRVAGRPVWARGSAVRPGERTFGSCGGRGRGPAGHVRQPWRRPGTGSG